MDAIAFAARRFGAFACAVALLVVSLPALAQPHLYWSQYIYDAPIDRYSLHRSNLDGTRAVELNPSVAPEPYVGMAVYDGKLLWSTSGTGEVYAATLAGEELGEWTSPLPPAVRAEALGMAYDAASGSTYRALFELNAGDRNIERTDALGNTSIIPTDLFPANLALALDPLAQKLYFGGVTGGRAVIRRSNLDGSGVETVFDNLPMDPDIFDLALDPAGGKMYWTVRVTGAGKLQRANLDGTGVEDLVTGIPPGMIALDVVVPEPAAVVVVLLAGAQLLQIRPPRGARGMMGL